MKQDYMVMSDLASVIIALYNGEKYLKEQIKSLLNQTYNNIEIIIADDCSADNSFETAKAIAASEGHIKIYRNNKNLGVVDNFLNALSYTKGEYVLFCDQDDYWLPEKIERLKLLLDKGCSNMLAYSDLEVCDENMSVIYPSFWDLTGIRPRSGRLGELVFLKNLSPGCAMMFRKEVKDLLLKAGSRPPFMHDHLALVIACGLGNIVYSSERLVRYRQHTANNIGAFYDSVVNRHTVALGLKEKISYFKTVYENLPNFDLQRLSDFARTLQHNKPSLIGRMRFVRFYMFLRNDTLTDKLLGICECLFPNFYDLLKQIKTATPIQIKDIGIMFKRIFFFGWISLAGFFFVKEFVLYKLIRYMEWIKPKI